MSLPKVGCSRSTAARVACVLMLMAVPALAQRVTVLEFPGDRDGQLREQVEEAIRASGKTELVPFARYKQVSGKVSATPSYKAARTLQLSALVGGSARGTFKVKIMDPRGGELWARDIKLQRGLLPGDLARRLAMAIQVAAAQSAPPPPEREPLREMPVREVPVREVPVREVPVRPSPEPAPEAPVAEAPTRRTEPPTRERPDKGELTESLAKGRAEPAPPRVTRRDPDADTAETAETNASTPSDSDSDTHVASSSSTKEGPEPQTPDPKPPIIEVYATGTTTWRTYCGRPGFTSCAAANTPAGIAENVAGNRVDFVSNVPYVGGDIHALFSPFANAGGLFLPGLALGGQLERGFSLAKVKVNDGTEQPTNAADTVFDVHAQWRFLFNAGGDGEVRVGGVGAEAGFGGRSFTVDNVNVGLPASSRTYPMLRLTASYPFSNYFRLEAEGGLLLQAIPTKEQSQQYGGAVLTTGFDFNGGVSGMLYGPLGYLVRFSFMRFVDEYTGKGANWGNGGVVEETYSQLFFGLSYSM